MVFKLGQDIQSFKGIKSKKKNPKVHKRKKTYNETLAIKKVEWNIQNHYYLGGSLTSLIFFCVLFYISLPQ